MQRSENQSVLPSFVAEVKTKLQSMPWPLASTIWSPFSPVNGLYCCILSSCHEPRSLVRVETASAPSSPLLSVSAGVLEHPTATSDTRATMEHATAEYLR